MRTALLCLFAAGLLVAAPVPKALKARKTDAELLEGRWEVVTLDRGGGPQPRKGDDAEIYWEFKSGKLFIGADDGETRSWRKLEVDPTTNPKQLSFGWETVFTGLAVYEIDGDTLNVCVNQLEQPRPTEFKGSRIADSYVLKRAKE
jgi:uncharacterized protein (TIGR03067 family)